VSISEDLAMKDHKKSIFTSLPEFCAHGARALYE